MFLLKACLKLKRVGEKDETYFKMHHFEEFMKPLFPQGGRVNKLNSLIPNKSPTAAPNTTCPILYRAPFKHFLNLTVTSLFI